MPPTATRPAPKSSALPIAQLVPTPVRPAEVYQALDEHTRAVIDQLTTSPNPDLIKSFDIGEPTDYYGDYPWHVLPKVKLFGLPALGCQGLFNPNTELEYLVTVDEGTPQWKPTDKPLLQVANAWCQQVSTPNGVKGHITFMPYDSSTVMAVVELANPSAAPAKVYVRQLLLKEVLGGEKLYRLYPKQDSDQPMFWVSTNKLADYFSKPDGDGLVFYEIERVPPGELQAVGYLLAFVGGGAIEPQRKLTSVKAVEAPPPSATAPDNTVYHRCERVYEVALKPGENITMGMHLSLRRFGPNSVRYPRGVAPFLNGDYETALAYMRKKLQAAYAVDWRKQLEQSLAYYAHYPVIELPTPGWNGCFQACLNLPRAETFSPYGTMPLPFYNFVRAWGNDYRYWFSYGEHGHESLSTFVTALTDPGLAANHLRGHFINQDTRGSFPYGVSQQSKPDLRTFADQAVTCPFIAWEAWNTYLWGGDQAFLKEAYLACKKDYAWWMEARDRNRDGLVCWVDYGETVRDDGNNPTWHYLPTDEKSYLCTHNGRKVSLGCAPVIFQEALDVNCYLLNYERVMSLMAGELGEATAAAAHRQAWDRRTRSMNAYMYDPSAKLYFGITEVNDLKVKTKDVSTLMPLWAGIAPLERAQPLVEIYKNPKEFFTKYPVPSLAASDSIYEPSGHWEGSGWVEMTWLVILGLKNYGYYEEAAWLARNQCEMVFNELLKTGYFREYWNPESGKGLGLYDYIWACMPGAFVTDIFFGARPEPEGLEVMPALPADWNRIAVKNLMLRGRRLSIEVTRSAQIAQTQAEVNGQPWVELVGNRGIKIPWARVQGDLVIVIRQPAKIAETYAPPYPLPPDVLEPLPARRYVAPTTEELNYWPRFMHDAIDPAQLQPPPKANRL